MISMILIHTMTYLNDIHYNTQLNHILNMIFMILIHTMTYLNDIHYNTSFKYIFVHVTMIKFRLILEVYLLHQIRHVILMHCH